MQPDINTDAAFASFLPGMPQEDDKSLIVRFYVGKKLLGAKSHEVGREVYVDCEYVEIKVKGQDKQVVVEEVKAHHRQKYPVAYHQFSMKKPAPVVGTPIEQLHGVGPSMAHHLRGLNLRSVEDVASVSDENTLQAMGMGARDLVKRAKAWLEQTNEKAVSLEQENATLRADLARMNEGMRQMQEQIAALAEKKKGRPKKPEPQ